MRVYQIRGCKIGSHSNYFANKFKVIGACITGLNKETVKECVRECDGCPIPIKVCGYSTRDWQRLRSHSAAGDAFPYVGFAEEAFHRI